MFFMMTFEMSNLSVKGKVLLSAFGRYIYITVMHAIKKTAMHRGYMSWHHE